MTYTAEVDDKVYDRSVAFPTWKMAVRSAMNLVSLGFAASKPVIRAVRR